MIVLQKLAASVYEPVYAKLSKSKAKVNSTSSGSTTIRWDEGVVERGTSAILDGTDNEAESPRRKYIPARHRTSEETLTADMRRCKVATARPGVGKFKLTGTEVVGEVSPDGTTFRMSGPDRKRRRAEFDRLSKKRPASGEPAQLSARMHASDGDASANAERTGRTTSTAAAMTGEPAAPPKDRSPA